MIFDLVLDEMKKGGGKIFSGFEVFLLYDIYGFLIDFIFEVVEEVGFDVDCIVFDVFMQEQCQCVKDDVRNCKWQFVDVLVYCDLCVFGEIGFDGYIVFEVEFCVLGLFVDGVFVCIVIEGQIVEVVFVEIMLYVEFGGQVVDKGIIVGFGYMFEVLDVQKLVFGLISYMVEVSCGSVVVDDIVIIVVDVVNCCVVCQVYLVMYFVYVVFWDMFGLMVIQVGLLNCVGYMWFDFFWLQFFFIDMCSEIEEIINCVVQEVFEVIMWIVLFDEVKEVGVMVFFGEKYGDVVCMVDIGGFWLCELCVGMYVSMSVEIGLVSFVGEFLVGVLNCCIEVFVGVDVFCELVVECIIVLQFMSVFKILCEQLLEWIVDFIVSLKVVEKWIVQFEVKECVGQVFVIVEVVFCVGGFCFVVQNFGEVVFVDDVCDLVNGVCECFGMEVVVVVFGVVVNGCFVVVVVINDVVCLVGVKVGVFVKCVVGVFGGGGGGCDDFVQGGGVDVGVFFVVFDVIVQELYVV